LNNTDEERDDKGGDEARNRERLYLSRAQQVGALTVLGLVLALVLYRLVG
jgi:hypothetical protein